MILGEPIARLDECSSLTRSTRVRAPPGRRRSFLTCLLLLLLISANHFAQSTCLSICQLSALPAAPAAICRQLMQFRRTGKFFRSRCSYYANCDASFQYCRLRLAGDVEPNPGPDQRAITVLCQNARSVRNKLHTLRALAPDLSSHDVFSLTETWLTPDVMDSELQHGWPNHVWFRKDRDGHGGGVACAIRSSLCPIRRADLDRLPSRFPFTTLLQGAGAPPRR